MLSVTRKSKFRALIIDDDEAVLDRLTNLLRGQSVTVGRRRLEPDIDRLRVEVVPKSTGGYEFSAATRTDLLSVCKQRYDLVLLDYSYASKEMQAKQWREGQNSRSEIESNDHLLTVVELKSALESDADDGAHRKSPAVLAEIPHL